MATELEIQQAIDDIPENTLNGVTSAILKAAFQKLKNREMFSGDFSDLDNVPDFFSGEFSDLANIPNFFSGDFVDLDNIPDFFSGEFSDLANIPNFFSGAYSELEDIPETIEHKNRYRARVYEFEEEEEKLIQDDVIWHSGAQILANRPTTMNILIYPSQLKKGFETFIDQLGAGPLNFVNAEPSDFEIIIPEGKIPQTENRLDSVSILVWDHVIIIKGDLKDE